MQVLFVGYYCRNHVSGNGLMGDREINKVKKKIRTRTAASKPTTETNNRHPHRHTQRHTDANIHRHTNANIQMLTLCDGGN